MYKLWFPPKKEHFCVVSKIGKNFFQISFWPHFDKAIPIFSIFYLQSISHLLYENVAKLAFLNEIISFKKIRIFTSLLKFLYSRSRISRPVGKNIPSLVLLRSKESDTQLYTKVLQSDLWFSHTRNEKFIKANIKIEQSRLLRKTTSL